MNRHDTTPAYYMYKEELIKNAKYDMLDEINYYYALYLLKNSSNFEYDIVIAKCYTLSGIVWEIKMPNYIDHDKNLYRLVVRSIEYAASEFPQRFRLVDELYKKDLFRKL